MKFIARICLLLVLVFALTPNNNAQVKAIGADATDTTKYSPSDSIYVYNLYTDTVPVPGVFEVRNVTGGKANFAWSHYDTASHTFVNLPQNDVNIDTSRFTTSIAGGYRVYITNANGPNDTITFWYFPHKINITVIKDENGYFYEYSCGYVDLEAEAMLDTFVYYNPITHKKILLRTTPDYTWTADPEPTSALPKPNPNKNPLTVRNNKPPFEDTEYTLTYTDNFNYLTTGSALFKAIRAKADFRIDADSTTKTTDGLISAPYGFKLRNTSLKADRFVWYLDTNDTIYTNDTATIHYTFYESKTYKIRLIAKNSQTTCVDSIFQEVIVEKPRIEKEEGKFPNILVIGGENHIFKPIKPLSIKNYHFVIITRWGKVVYEENGYDIRGMKGWDGYYKGSAASEGVYYYILKADSFNKDQTPLKDVYKGYFYVYNNSQ